MAQMRFDLIDVAPLIAFVAASLVSLELATNFPGADFLAQGFYTFAEGGTSVTLSVGAVLQILSLFVALYTNDLSFSALGGIQLWLVIVTIWLVLAPPFMPILDAYLSGSGAVVAFLVQTVGFGVTGYTG